VGVLSGPRQFRAMLRNGAITRSDRLQLDLIFCLYTRTRQSGRGKKSDAICRCYQSEALL